MRPKYRIALILTGLTLVAQPLHEHPLFWELRFEKSAVHLKKGRIEMRWFRDRPISTEVHTLRTGRRIYYLQAFGIADVGASPLKDADEIAAWAAHQPVHTLIWRKTDLKNLKQFDQKLPRSIRRVIVTSLRQIPPGRHRLWLSARAGEAPARRFKIRY